MLAKDVLNYIVFRETPYDINIFGAICGTEIKGLSHDRNAQKRAEKEHDYYDSMNTMGLQLVCNWYEEMRVDSAMRS